MNRPLIFIMTGAALWGTIGWFVKHLNAYGFTPMEVVTLRVVTAAIVLSTYMIFAARQELKLKQFTDIKYFIGTGVFSIIFFNYCMFTAIELSTIPIATALLYTAPGFVLILSFLLFKEKLTSLKILSLFVTLIGAAFVAGVIPLQLEQLQWKAILFGLGSGFGYALYSIFSKFALQKYSSLSITTYTFICAAFTLIFFFPFQEKGQLLMDPTILFLAFGLGIIPTALAYIIYTYGLHHTAASTASILSTIEPVVATMIGVFLFSEAFSLIQFICMACIIGAVIIIQIDAKKQLTKELMITE